MVLSQIKDVTPIQWKYKVVVSLYLNSTAQDIDNFSCVWMKFILDALVKAWKVEGDSNKNLVELHTFFRGIDKENPRIVMCVI